MFQCAGVVMKVKGCSQFGLASFPSFHFTPHYILTNFPIIPSFPKKIPLFTSFHPCHLVSHISLTNYLPNVISQPKTPFPCCETHSPWKNTLFPRHFPLKIISPLLNSFIPCKPTKTRYPKFEYCIGPHSKNPPQHPFNLYP